MTTTSEHRDRRTYLGGTDMAALLGRSAWKTRLDVFNVKTGREVVQQNEAMGWGLLLEPVVLQEYGRRTNRIIRPGDFRTLAGKDFIGGTTDGSACGADVNPLTCGLATHDNPEGWRLVECKVASASSRRTWEKGIPFDYQCQAQLYMLLNDFQLTTFVVLFGGNELVTYELEADPILQHTMVAMAEMFWTEHILKDLAPAPSVPGWDDVQDREPSGTVREANDETVRVLHELTSLREARSGLEEREAQCIDYLQWYAPDGAITIKGKEVASWTTKTRKPTVLEAKTWKQFSVKPLTVLQKVLGGGV